jgi:glycosyltransferase involved in cell wall biosynthesis
MKKLRVGVMFDEELFPEIGGGYTYYTKLVSGINQFSFHPHIEIINILHEHHLSDNTVLPVKPFIVIPRRIAKKIKSKLGSLTVNRLRNLFPSAAGLITQMQMTVSEKENRLTEKIFRENNIDLVYYLKPTLHILDYPVIMTSWDLGHRSMDAFPEKSIPHVYDDAEHFLNSTLSKADLIFCESEAGAEEIIGLKPAYKEKIHVLPIFAGDVINMEVSETEQQATLKGLYLESFKYFFYPAQFWPHKNHYNLIQAFRLFIEKTTENIKLVLSGSDQGNLKYIKEVALQSGVSNSILFPGFVTNSQLYTLYKNAIALVMPTYLGPTNMPLLEASFLGCPVLCSNLKGHKEMLGENALYFEPSDAMDISEKMIHISHPEQRKSQIENALTAIQHSQFTIEKALNRLNESLSLLHAKEEAETF